LSARTMAVLIIPSICDLLCTLLLLVAQLYITASMWQMMRGSIIIITALLKRGVLGHRLKRHMWLGVGIITVAMMLVASTSFFGGPEEGSGEGSKDPRVGILLVLVGCLAQGVQYVFEEKVMAVDNAPPLVVIGCEGLWGTLLTLLLVYPLAYALPGEDGGRFEDPWDALAMVRHSASLQRLVPLFVLFVTGYNCMAVYVTSFLSAIWHAIMDNFRPVTIWGCDLLIFYVLLPHQGFGEAWVPASWLQLGGLLVLFLGTAVYNGSVCVFSDVGPGPEEQPLREGPGTQGGWIKTPADMASPSLMKSPLMHRQERAGHALEMHPAQGHYSSLAMSRDV